MDEDDFTMPLADFVAEMQAVVEKEGDNAAGLEFRVELDPDYYDDPTTLDVCVQRPETDAEMALREKEEAERARRYAEYQMASARARYERLKAQFEGY